MLEQEAETKRRRGERLWRRNFVLENVVVVGHHQGGGGERVKLTFPPLFMVG